jgi:3-hydroxyisobutyrate dehydrogenase
VTDGSAKLRPPFPGWTGSPEFPLEWALKDVDLAIDAAGRTLPVLSALARQWREAVDSGHGRQDVSAARLALRR